MAKMKGGELIAEYLIKQKVPYLFGICGHGNVGILDPLYAVRDKLKLISPRHEQCAGHMADGYFRVKHQPVATLTSTGPGMCSLTCAINSARNFHRHPRLASGDLTPVGLKRALNSPLPKSHVAS